MAITGDALASYECKTDGHNKFWKIWNLYDEDATSGVKWGFTTHWGKIGLKGTSNTKWFFSSYQRNVARSKLVNSKLDKGYHKTSTCSPDEKVFPSTGSLVDFIPGPSGPVGITGPAGPAYPSSFKGSTGATGPVGPLSSTGSFPPSGMIGYDLAKEVEKVKKALRCRCGRATLGLEVCVICGGGTCASCGNTKAYGGEYTWACCTASVPTIYGDSSCWEKRDSLIHKGKRFDVRPTGGVLFEAFKELPREVRDALTERIDDLDLF